MSYTISGKRLILENGKEIIFDYDIAHSIEASGMVVVVLHPQRDICTPDNVYGVSADGSIIWQINTRGRFGMKQGSFFCGIAGEKNGIVYLFHYVGQRVQIDPRDGTILHSEFTK